MKARKSVMSYSGIALFGSYRSKSNADEMERMRKQSESKGGVLGRVCGIMKEKNTKQKGEIR